MNQTFVSKIASSQSEHASQYIKAVVYLMLQTLQSICSINMTGPFDVSGRSHNSNYYIISISHHFRSRFTPTDSPREVG